MVVGEEPFDLETKEIELKDGIILEPPAAGEEIVEEDNEVEVTQNLPKDNAKKLKEKYSKIVWKKKRSVLWEESLKFLVDEHISNLESPISFFLYFFDNDLLEKVKNLTSVQLKKYLAICIRYMSIVHMPNARNYWSASLVIAR